jgi:hypothetical protein
MDWGFFIGLEGVMVWFWFSVISILILAVLAFLWAARIRKQRLEQKLRLEITNQGNVESHFQLRVEELTGQLEFRFTCAGSRLPEVFEIDPAGQVAGRQPLTAQPATTGSGVKASQKAQNAMNLSFTVASILTSLGSILPRSLGTHFSQAGSQLYQGQAQATRVQQVSSQAASLAPGTRNNPAEAAPISPNSSVSAPVHGFTWVETPAIIPGRIMIVDLMVRSAWLAGDTIRSFQVKSRSTEGGPAKAIVEDGQVLIRGGFWAHRVYPSLLILAAAILAFLLAIWVARLNGLPV